MGRVYLRLSATLRIDLDQLLVSDGSKVSRLFPYVGQLAAVQTGRLLLIPDGHAPQFVCHVLAGRNMRLLCTGHSEFKEFFVGPHWCPANAIRSQLHDVGALTQINPFLDASRDGLLMYVKQT
jgi:hypothetical protein